MTDEIKTDEIKDAHFSPCGRYRYSLSKIWEPDKPKVVFIGLHPPDHESDDATIRRCRRFAKDYGAGGLVMVNLFAFRATDPKVMKAAADPVGPDNDEWLLKLATEEYDTDIGPMSEGEPGEGQPPFYHLFDNSYGGGSWNAALIAEADVQRRRAEKAEGEAAQFKAVAEAAQAYRLHIFACEDCAEELPCENGMDIYDRLLTRVDDLYGKPSDQAERQPT